MKHHLTTLEVGQLYCNIFRMKVFNKSKLGRNIVLYPGSLLLYLGTESKQIHLFYFLSVDVFNRKSEIDHEFESRFVNSVVIFFESSFNEETVDNIMRKVSCCEDVEKIKKEIAKRHEDIFRTTYKDMSF